MKRKFILLFQIFLVWSCVQAQFQSDRDDIAPLRRKSLPIKFQRGLPFENENFGSGYFTFPIQFTSENIEIPVVVSTSTSAVWINSKSYSDLKGKPFKCAESKSCQRIEPKESQWTWANGGWRENFWGTLVKEQISLGGLTLPNFDVFMTNKSKFLEEYSGILGLRFQRTNPVVPTVYDYLLKGLVEEPIVSINLQSLLEGELIFGGYPHNKTREDFKFVPLYEEVRGYAGFSLPIKAVGYGNWIPEEGSAVLDFDSSWISLPKWGYDQINDEVNYRGLEISYPPPQGLPWTHPDGQRPVKCKARDLLRDLIVEFEGFTLLIPTSAYIIRAKGWTVDQEESTEEGCWLTLLPQDAADHRIVLGQPFFRAYDVAFDYGRNSVGFSRKPLLESDFHHSRDLMPYILITTGLASFILLGYCLTVAAKKFQFKRSYVAFSGEGVPLDGSSSVIAPVTGQEESGQPIPSLPYQDGSHHYVDIPSSEKIEKNSA